MLLHHFIVCPSTKQTVVQYIFTKLQYNRSRITANSMQVKAPITLQEKLVIIYALHFIKVFVAEDAQRFNAQKNRLQKLRCAFTFVKH